MKRLSLLLLACFFTSFLFAGDGIGLASNYAKKKRKKSKFDKSRIFVGGNLGGGGQQGGYFINVSPSIGYRLTDRFHAGVNLGYFFSRQKIDTDNIGSFSQRNLRVVSTSVFARFFPIDVVFLQVRPELSFVTEKYKEYYAFQNQTLEQTYQNRLPAFLVGGGYAQRVGGNSYMMVSVMYDLVQNPRSPYYRQPVFGGGLALGLFGR